MPTSQEIKTVFTLLEKTHPQTMLEQMAGSSSFQMLMATLLSARTKDLTVIPIVKDLFKKYPTPKDFLKISVTELEKKFYKIGFFRVKSKNVKKLAEILVKEYNGKVPNTLEELTSLPGVGRKTANCMLNYAFNKPAIAVDIHVHRISNRLGWIDTKTPEKSEEALEKVIPKDEWINVNKLFVGHGQTICAPINPRCNVCQVKKYCKYGKNKFEES